MISTATSFKFEVVIQVQGDQYFPRVKHKTDFAYVGQLAVNPPKPIDNASEQMGTIADMLELIAADNKRILVSYEQKRKTLLSMVAAGELSKDQLIDLYIEFLPQDMTSITNRAHFFSDLEQLERKPIVAEFFDGREQQVIHLLADTLAGWISTNQIDADQLFDRIDSKSTLPLAR